MPLRGRVLAERVLPPRHHVAVELRELLGDAVLLLPEEGGAAGSPLSKLMENAPVEKGDAEPISDSGAPSRG